MRVEKISELSRFLFFFKVINVQGKWVCTTETSSKKQKVRCFLKVREKNQLFRFFQQHNSLSSLSQRHTTLWQLIQQPCGLESILFWVLPSWRSIASQGPWRSLDVWQTKAVQLPQGPSHFSRQPKWLSQCCFLVIFKTQGVRSQSSILCRGRLKMRGRMSIIRTLQKEFVSSRNWVHSLKFLKGISDLISEAN